MGQQSYSAHVTSGGTGVVVVQYQARCTGWSTEAMGHTHNCHHVQTRESARHPKLPLEALEFRQDAMLADDESRVSGSSLVIVRQPLDVVCIAPLS